MIRQSQNYFAAAVSAAVLNAAAVGAFVLFTLLSQAGSFPLQDLFSSGNTVTPASSSGASGDGEAAPGDSLTRSLGPSAFTFPSDGRALADTKIVDGSNTGPRPFNGGPGEGGTDNGSTGSLPGVGSTGSGGSGSGGAGGGVPGIIGGAGSLPPVSPQQSTGGQIGGAVSQAPSALNQGVGGAVGAADQATGGALSQAGVTQTVKGASNSLLGPGSAVDKAAGSVGGALNGASNRIASAPKAPAVPAPVSAPKAPAGLPLG